MIRHIIFFSAKDRADVDAIVEGLSVLARIPHSLHFEVARNMHTDRLSSEVDVVVYGEFADETALSAFKAHPLYQESIARVRPLRDTRYAADYESETVSVSSKSVEG